MARLIITDADGGQREFALSKDRTSIGRHADNDVRLDDRAVSSHHAVILTMLHDCFLEDLDSTNGTLVDGRQVTRHRLNDAETVTIGRNQLRFVADPLERVPAADKTQILKPTEVQALIAGVRGTVLAPSTAPAPTPAPPPVYARREAPAPLREPARPAPVTAAPSRTSPPPRPGKVMIASGPSAGREMELTKVVTMLGKPGVQVAAITRRADGYYIQSIGNRVPPLLNRQPLGAQAVRLGNRDEIELAGTQMTFLLPVTS